MPGLPGTAAAQQAPKTVINTPQTAIAHNPAAPHVQDTQGNTLQAVPGQPNKYAYTNLSTGQAPSTTVPEVKKYPYVSGNPEEQYDIIVTRTGVNFAGSLPWVIGLGDEVIDDYVDFLGLIPNQASNTPASVMYVGGNLVFTYTNGMGSDTITISCAQMSYSVFLKRLDLKEYWVSTTRVALSDNSQLGQLSTPIQRAKRFEDGGVYERPLSYRANYSGYQFTPIIDVGRDVYLSRMRGLQGGIINVNGFSTTYSLFVKQVSMIQKQNESAQ